jgi:Bacterial regulatory helix-turn-helix protein, lysR family
MEWSERIGRRIRLRDLHILLAVVQCKGLAAAAEHLAISRPVVSKVIAVQLQGSYTLLLLHAISQTPIAIVIIPTVADFDRVRMSARPACIEGARHEKWA